VVSPDSAARHPKPRRFSTLRFNYDTSIALYKRIQPAASLVTLADARERARLRTPCSSNDDANLGCSIRVI
jgi:hypothetical protein